MFYFLLNLFQVLLRVLKPKFIGLIMLFILNSKKLWTLHAIFSFKRFSISALIIKNNLLFSHTVSTHIFCSFFNLINFAAYGNQIIFYELIYMSQFNDNFKCVFLSLFLFLSYVYLWIIKKNVNNLLDIVKNMFFFLKILWNSIRAGLPNETCMR